jgi:signal transduction histidine kinase
MSSKEYSLHVFSAGAVAPPLQKAVNIFEINQGVKCRFVPGKPEALLAAIAVEKMGDILHDFKNPAIAIAGFAKRLERILSEVPDLPKKEKIQPAMEIILEESSRIQALALTLHGEGKETTLDMTDILKKTFPDQ